MSALQGVEQGAVDSGLPRQSAGKFARQALLGTALLLEDLGDSPAGLKDRVASPGGTTIAGLAALEARAVRGSLIRAVDHAVKDAGEGRQK
jgi:pyrroline-5-carboxylate reductase